MPRTHVLLRGYQHLRSRLLARKIKPPTAETTRVLVSALLLLLSGPAGAEPAGGKGATQSSLAAESLAIEDVQFAVPQDPRLSDEVEVRVLVRNRSPRTFYVVSVNRSGHYEAGVLTLAFLEEGRNTTAVYHIPFKLERIDPGQQKTISSLERLRWVRIKGIRGTTPVTSERQDLSGLKRVVVRMAFSERPIVPDQRLHIREYSKLLQSFGTVAEASFDRVLPEELRRRAQRHERD